MGFTVLLGALLKTFFEVELAAILLKCIFDVFLKRDSSLCRMLSYMTEPVIYPVRVVFSATGIFSRVPIDMSVCVGFFVLAALDFIFGTWF